MPRERKVVLAGDANSSRSIYRAPVYLTLMAQSLYKIHLVLLTLLTISQLHYKQQ